MTAVYAVLAVVFFCFGCLTAMLLHAPLMDEAMADTGDDLMAVADAVSEHDEVAEADLAMWEIENGWIKS